nr:MAG TPA: hypothetical protein [Caudoviricetes sp.]
MRNHLHCAGVYGIILEEIRTEPCFKRDFNKNTPRNKKSACIC